jgi:hypothetical protein
MHALGGERILTAWERGQASQEPWRALILLAVAMPEREITKLATLPLAERNAALLRLHSMTFGHKIEGFGVCAECGQQLEFAMDADDLERTLRAPEPETWVEGDLEMGMRPADSNDLAASMEAASEEDARALLLARTLGIGGMEMVRLDRTDWIDRFDRLNASAEIRCVLPCAHCGQRAALDFDVAGFVWREIQVAARRLMAEIHRLASAYGWSEKAVVRMSAARRAAYLEMLNA